MKSLFVSLPSLLLAVAMPLMGPGSLAQHGESSATLVEYGEGRQRHE